MTAKSDNEATPWPFPNPRVSGVREHFQRVKFFHDLAGKCSDPAGKFRLLLAGVYSARAMAELIFEASDKGDLNRTRDELKMHLCKQISWYDLIEKIRIHDFHRFGLVPPDPRFKVTRQGGPVKLRARKGSAVYQLLPSGTKKLTTGNSDIQEQRPLLSSDGLFFDDVTRQYVSLDQILHDFVVIGIDVVKEFEKGFSKTSPSI